MVTTVLSPRCAWCFDRHIGTHTRAGLEFVDAPTNTVKVYVQNKLVTGLYRTLETCAVNADKVVNRVVVRRGSLHIK
jgi:hypothetical protein